MTAGCTKLTFRKITSIALFAILDARKSLSIALLAISAFTKRCPPSATLDAKKSLSILFLAISDQ